jgi:GNAT superfamily N-acetyltransferase
VEALRRREQVRPPRLRRWQADRQLLHLAGTIGLVLNGSSVLPEARGRGAYRALVAARWARAVELEKPALVVQAGSMSRPILERCGFQPICVLDLLDDSAVAPAAAA